MIVPLCTWHAVGCLKISVCICFISAVNICAFIHFRRDEDNDDEDDCGRGDDVFEAEALERGEYIVSRDNSSSDDSRDRSPVRSQGGREIISYLAY